MQHVVHRQVTAFVTENQPRRTKASERRGGLPTHSIGTFSWCPWVFPCELAWNKPVEAKRCVAPPTESDDVLGELEDVPWLFFGRGRETANSGWRQIGYF